MISKVTWRGDISEVFSLKRENKNNFFVQQTLGMHLRYCLILKTDHPCLTEPPRNHPLENEQENGEIETWIKNIRVGKKTQEKEKDALLGSI